jgi:hypothetical protein
MNTYRLPNESITSFNIRKLEVEFTRDEGLSIGFKYEPRCGSNRGLDVLRQCFSP